MPIEVLNNEVYLPAPQLDGVNLGISIVLAACRIRRKLTEPSLLYILPNCRYSDKNLKGEPAPTIITPNLELKLAGAVTARNCYEALADNAQFIGYIRNIYKSDIAVKVKKGPKPELLKWWERQFNIWETSSSCIMETDPTPLSFKRDEWTRIYVDPDIITEGPTPTWDQFLSQMIESDQQIFKTFLWCPFVSTNWGRQVLYLWDGGKTGKSTVARVIFHYLPSMAGAISLPTLDTRFGYSTIEGKRLLIYSDCKHPHIIQSEKIHNITGGDAVQVEFKSLKPFTKQLYSRVIVMANDPPSISSYKAHERTRLIPIQLNPSLCTSREHYNSEGFFIGNAAFEKGLQNEFYHFLFKCKEAYKELCPSNMEIIIKNEDGYIPTACEDEDLFDHYFETYFELDPNSMIPAHAMMVKILEWSKVNSRVSAYLMKDWKHYLNSKGVVFNRYKHKKVYSGIKFKDDQEGITL